MDSHPFRATPHGVIPAFTWEQASEVQRSVYFCKVCHKPKLSWQGTCTSCWKKWKKENPDAS